MQNSMVVFTFSFLEWKYTFWVNLVQKLKIVNLGWNLTPSLIRIRSIQYVCFSRFRPETSFLGKFGPKTQNCQFKLKFGTYTNSNMQNSMMMFTYSVFDRKNLFWGKLVPKIKNKFHKCGTQTNSNMKN